MAKVGAQRAAELTGKSKSTIQRAMKSGKLSFEMDKTGHRVIDVSELERVYGLEKQESATPSKADALKEAEQLLETERLKLQLKNAQDQLQMAEEQIDDLKTQRDQWQKQAQQVLITSQYSQEQAKTYQEELQKHRQAEEAKRHAIMKKKAMMKARMAKMEADNQNTSETPSSETQGAGSLLSVWNKLKKRA